MKIMDQATTIYFAEPFHQVMGKIKPQQPALILTNAKLYDYYHTLIPASLDVPVSWFIVPPEQEGPTFDHLADVFQLFQDEKLTQCLVIGFGPPEILTLAGAFASVCAGVAALWLFPQNQAGLFTAIHSRRALRFDRSADCFAVACQAQVIFFEEGIEADGPTRLSARQTDLLYLLIVALLQSRENFWQLVRAYPNANTLLKVSQLSFIDGELQTLVTQRDEVDAVLTQILAIKKVFGSFIFQPEPILLALALLFYLFVSRKAPDTRKNMLEFKAWLTRLGFLVPLVSLHLPAKIAQHLPENFSLSANFGQVERVKKSSAVWLGELTQFFNFLLEETVTDEFQ